MMRIAPEIKCSLPRFTGYSFIKKFIEIRRLLLVLSALQFWIHGRIQDPDSDPDPAQNVTKSYRPPQLSTHKILSKSVHNFFRYPAEMQKSSVNPVLGSGLSSRLGSKVNQFVHVPTSVDMQHFIQIHRNPSITSSDIPLKCKNPV